MQIDSFTVLLFGLFIKLVLGGLFLVFWFKQRGAPWYAWWSAALFLACAATVLFACAASPPICSRSGSATSP